MNAKEFLENFGHLADAPDGISKLRQTILQLAVQGKLVEQDPNEVSASETLGALELSPLVWTDCASHFSDGIFAFGTVNVTAGGRCREQGWFL